MIPAPSCLAKVLYSSTGMIKNGYLNGNCTPWLLCGTEILYTGKNPDPGHLQHQCWGRWWCHHSSNRCWHGDVVEVLGDLGDVASACALLRGVIYAPNLCYPQELKAFFEVLQKLVLQLEAGRLSTKVQEQTMNEQTIDLDAKCSVE